MYYPNLHALCAGSHSSRAYFLSLPAEEQLRLCEHAAYIHTAEDLHRRVDLAALRERADLLAEAGLFRYHNERIIPRL